MARRNSVKDLVNFSDTERKRRFLSWAGALSDWWEVHLSPKRDTRTLRQNALWHSRIVKPYFDFLRDQDYEISHPYQAHMLLREKLLSVPIINKSTGEAIGWVPRSTRDLSKEEFSDLIERAVSYLAEQFGIICELKREEHM